MMILNLLVLGMAVERTTELLSRSTLLARPRVWLLNGGPWVRTWGVFNFAGRAVQCPTCCSWWAAGLFTWYGATIHLFPLELVPVALPAIGFLAGACHDVIKRVAGKSGHTPPPPGGNPG